MSITSSLGEQRTVEIPAGTIAYRERGEGPALVFVHGVGVNGDLWRHVAPPLASEFRCVVPDTSSRRAVRFTTRRHLPSQ